MSNNLVGRIVKMGCAAVILLAACVLMWPVTGGSQDSLPFKLPGAQVPNYRTYSIGVLQGTWNEMGVQYGERTAPDVRWEFDRIWDSYMRPDPWAYGNMTEQERTKYILDYLDKSFKELGYLSPQVIDFMQGVAKGAEKELNKSKYASVCSNFQKICVTTYGGEGKLHPSTSPYYYEPNKPPKSEGVAVKSVVPAPDSDESSECHWFWMNGRATKSGDTIAMTQGTHGYQNLRTVSYVAVPTDPRAHVFYGFGWAGQVAGSGGAAFNENGVGMLTSGTQGKSSNDQADETLAPGIMDHILGYCAVIFSDTAKQAADYVTVGTADYRAKTGRKTVLRRRGSNIVLVDAKEAYDVEQNARHYAIRKPGYLGETNSDFIAGANHFMFKDGSFDENNVWNANEPMTKYDPEVAEGGSYYRFWSCFWEIKNRYGKIDKDTVLRQILTSHTAYDQSGKAYPPDANGVPTKQFPVCTHQGARTKENPLGTGGSAKIRVFIPNKLEVYWIEGWPCAYEDKGWNSLSLKPFSEYRKLLFAAGPRASR